MRAEGLEPPSSLEHRHLKPACLPNSTTPAGVVRIEPSRVSAMGSMIRAMAVGEGRPGYELWRPNREKAQSKTTKLVIVVMLLVSAAVAALITFGGFSLLEGGGGMGI